jgi:hypothetical protein
MVPNSSRWFSWKNLISFRTAMGVICLMLVVWFGAAFALNQRQIFLPGETSVGHHLFETSCSSCHQAFQPVSNDTCMSCHQAELAEDAHGPSKFRDPRWAAELANLDVMTCTTCHSEHVHMFGRGVHLQPDLCMNCHQGLIEGNLASHNGFSPDGCWTGGCHNYHDQRSISTGFLRRNMGDPPMLPVQQLPERTLVLQRDVAPPPDLTQEFLEEGQ